MQVCICTCPHACRAPLEMCANCFLLGIIMVRSNGGSNENEEGHMGVHGLFNQLRLYFNIIMDSLHKSRTTPHRLYLSSVCSTHCLGDSHLGVVLMSFKRQLATIWNHQQLSWSVLPLGISLGGCLIASWYKKRQQGPLWEAPFPRQGCPYLHKAGEYCVRASHICLFLSALDWM